MKIIADYDPITGLIRDLSGNGWYVSIGLNFEEHKENSDTSRSKVMDTLVLIQNGISAEELIRLKDNGLI